MGRGCLGEWTQELLEGALSKTVRVYLVVVSRGKVELAFSSSDVGLDGSRGHDGLCACMCVHVCACVYMCIYVRVCVDVYGYT